MEKVVYFDHAASSGATPEILQKFQEYSLRYYANAEAVHLLAYESREVLKRAGEKISESLFGVKDHPVIWGNSATELFRVATSLPDFAAAKASKLEHPALLANLQRFTRHELLAVDECGNVKLPSGMGKCDICCLHQVQSELGIIQDTANIFKVVSPRCRLIDAVQSAGRMPVDKNADIWIISGVKFGAPGGAAMLLAPGGKFTDKLLKHAENYRKNDYAIGRVSVPLMLTVADALTLAVSNMEENCRRVTQINDFIRQCCAEMGIMPTLPETVSVSPYILNLMLPYQESAVVIRALSRHGIFAASGSACSAESNTPSPALTALGFPPQKAYRALRLSFAPSNTLEDAEIFISGLKNVLKNY